MDRTDTMVIYPQNKSMFEWYDSHTYLAIDEWDDKYGVYIEVNAFMAFGKHKHLGERFIEEYETRSRAQSVIEEVRNAYQNGVDDFYMPEY